MKRDKMEDDKFEIGECRICKQIRSLKNKVCTNCSKNSSSDFIDLFTSIINKENK